MEHNLTVCVTGHRPNALPGGYDDGSEANVALQVRLRDILLRLGNQFGKLHCISGMALGVDMMFANVALDLRDDHSYGVVVEAAVPCQNHPNKWPKQSQDKWQNIIDRVDIDTLVTDGVYAPYVMHVRNKYMVDKSDVVIVVMKAGTTSGGTYSAYTYAKKKGKQIILLDPLECIACPNGTLEVL